MRICPQCNSGCDEAHKFCPACGFPLSKVAKDNDDPMLGRTLPGGYVILDLVGIGGMGRVYRAEQTNLGRTVAVKIIHPHLVGEENAAARFITEARAASRLNHPNSVGVIDFGKTEDGQLYLVMEFLRGKDLARVMYEEGPLAFRRIVDVIRQTLAALAEAHILGIIHRDLKPENIILEPVRSGGDFVKVVDFGLAKMRVEASSPNITSPGIVCGTPEYMSPEQGRGDPLDARSDLYAVGVIMYQLMTGRLPFEAESPTQVVLMHISDPPPDPHKVAPERNIPQPLVDVCLMALAKETKHRFSAADEFAAALTDAMAQIEPSVRRMQPSLLSCPACGAANPATQKFCGECGGPLAVSPPSGRPVPAAIVSAPPPVETPAEIKLPEEPKPGPPPPMEKKPAQVDADKVALPLVFIERGEDLAWLHDRLADAKTSLVGARVVGEPGMGKTRLVREFLDQCAQNGDLVVVTGPDPSWAEVGYFALRKAIRELALLPEKVTDTAFVDAGPEAKQGLGYVFEIGTDGARLSAEERRFAVAEALRWAMVRGGERVKGRKVVVAVDDLAQVDGASRAAFADAVGEAPLVPALLVVSYTPGFDPGWQATASARILSGLPTTAVAKLLSGAASPSSPPTHATQTRGVAPMYVEQMIRFAREQGGTAPARLADLIALRVERQKLDARKVLQAVAVFGDDAREAAISRMVGDKIDLAAALGELDKAGMVQKVGETYRVAHPLLRDVVLASIPAGVRKELHSVAAGVCEEGGAPLEVRALHEYASQNTFQALILLEQVSTRCAMRGDSAASITALRRGLELARRELFRGELDDPLRAVLIFSRKLGEQLTNAGQFTDAEGVLREALDLAGPSGEDRARVLGALAQVAKGRDRKQEAHTYLREALELAFESGAHELLFALEDLKKSIAV